MTTTISSQSDGSLGESLCEQSHTLWRRTPSLHRVQHCRGERLKVLVTLWRNYEFEAVDKDERLLTSVGMDQKDGPLLCKVKKRQV
jgi:hypothetical protein